MAVVFGEERNYVLAVEPIPDSVIVKVHVLRNGSLTFFYAGDQSVQDVLDESSRVSKKETDNETRA